MSDWPLLSDVNTFAEPGNEKGNVEVFHEVKLPGSDSGKNLTQQSLL